MPSNLFCCLSSAQWQQFRQLMWHLLSSSGKSLQQQQKERRLIHCPSLRVPPLSPSEEYPLDGGCALWLPERDALQWFLRAAESIETNKFTRQRFMLHDEARTMLHGSKQCSMQYADHRWRKTKHQNLPSEALPLLTVVFQLAKPEVKTASNEPTQNPIKSVIWEHDETWNFS